jgi:hypothetical protein
MVMYVDHLNGPEYHRDFAESCQNDGETLYRLCDMAVLRILWFIVP